MSRNWGGQARVHPQSNDGGKATLSIHVPAQPNDDPNVLPDAPEQATVPVLALVEQAHLGAQLVVRRLVGLAELGRQDGGLLNDHRKLGADDAHALDLDPSPSI